jgi:hypothetical protein
MWIVGDRIVVNNELERSWTEIFMVYRNTYLRCRGRPRRDAVKIVNIQATWQFIHFYYYELYLMTFTEYSVNNVIAFNLLPANRSQNVL